MTKPLTFAGAYIERCTHLRSAIGSLLAHPESGYLLVHDGQCLVGADGLLLLDHAEAEAWLAAGASPIFLGRRAARYLFALAVDGAAPALMADRGSFRSLGDILASLTADDAALLAYARAMALWQQRHRYCGLCGAGNRPVDGGFVMSCSSEGCGQRSFPRLDPAIIVLVHDQSHCLLGRQASWPAGRFSTIAGFVEPGESLEDAVRREVLEESNIVVGACEYLASQPWPFPSAMMIGFHARAQSREIRLNDGELAEARWLSRAEIAAGSCQLPPQASIAYRLIERWYAAEPGYPPLASLGLAGRWLRNSGSAARQPPG